MSVSQTILQQLGGNKFRAMTGAKEFVGGPDYLQFTIPRANKINKVKVTLSRDLYDIEFMRYIPRELRYDTVKKVDGVYCDQLQAVFTAATGLYTSF